MTQDDPSNRSLRSDILFGFAIAFACYLAWLIRAELILIYVSALFAVVLRPLVLLVSRIRIGRFQPFRKTGIVLLILAAMLFIVTFLFLALPPVIRDTQQFASEMPTRLPAMVDQIERLPFVQQVDIDSLAAQAQQSATHAVTFLLLSVREWAGTVFTIAMGLILTIYFSIEGESTYNWALSFIPSESRSRLDAALRRAEVRMGKWLIGQGSLMLILGVASTIVYRALDVRYAYALGVLTGLLNVVPVLGAALSIALSMLAGAVDSWGRVLGIGIFYGIYLQVENSILIPRIMKHSVDLPALAILVALIIGSALAGIVGALVSVPTAVLVSVLLEEYWVMKEA